MMTVELYDTDDLNADQSATGLCEDESDPPDLYPTGARRQHAASAVPSTVWFGPKGSDTTERELIAFLGSHNGVAVLQWPRDANRSLRLSEFGIPILWLLPSVGDAPTDTGMQEWLPRAATLEQIHASLKRLSQRAAMRRARAPLLLDNDGCLCLGECRVKLDPAVRPIASSLLPASTRPSTTVSLAPAVTGLPLLVRVVHSSVAFIDLIGASTRSAWR
jgi:hypothetical protein